MPDIAGKSEGQRSAESEVEGFRQDLGPFVVAAETTRMPMVFTDAGAPERLVIFANDAFLELTGYAREEVLGRSFDALLADDAETSADEALRAAFADDAEGSVELCLRRKDGATFWGAVFVSPVRDKAGRTVQHFASVLDVTAHRLQEDHLHFLLDELNHRTQNTLATVQAIAVQTLRGHADKSVIDAFEGRILALSKAHSLLGRESWGAIDLREALNQILAPFGAGERPAIFTLNGPEASLPAKAALSLAMVFHELATNAAKYGALSDDAGRIDIAWTVEPSPGGDRLRLRWRESGGPTVKPPSRKGFGSRLIEGGLAQELDGDVRLDYAPQGVVCTIAMPLISRAADA